MRIAFLLLAFCLCGCYSQQYVDTENHAAFNAGGEQVGTLPDGREVKRVWILTNQGKWHALYFIGETTTVNHEEHAGKNSTTIETEAFIQ